MHPSFTKLDGKIEMKSILDHIIPRLTERNLLPSFVVRWT
jgi:hypothetical protein